MSVRTGIGNCRVYRGPPVVPALGSPCKLAWLARSHELCLEEYDGEWSRKTLDVNVHKHTHAYTHRYLYTYMGAHTNKHTPHVHVSSTRYCLSGRITVTLCITIAVILLIATPVGAVANSNRI